MIASDSGTGKSFIGLASYLATGKGGQQPERVQWSRGLNLSTDDIRFSAAEMRMAAAENTRVDRPVYHFSINWHPEESDRVDEEKAVEIVKATLDDLGLSEHQALIVAHSDTEHFHCHVMVNRIHPETKLSWKQGLSKIALERVMAQQSLVHGFEIVPGRHNAEELGIEAPHEDTTTPSEAMRYEDRTGGDCDLTLARDRLAATIGEAGSWDELAARLEAEGYRVEAAGRGLVFRDDDGGFIKASAVAREYSRKSLEERFEETFSDYVGRQEPVQDPHEADRGPDAEHSAERRPEAAQDPQADRPRPGPRVEDPAPALAPIEKALTEARSWNELEARLHDAGAELTRRGRGLGIEVDGQTVKPSDIARRFGTKSLEARFGPARDHFREREAARLPERSQALSAAVKKLLAFERATGELQTALVERDKVFQRTERTFRTFREIARAKRTFEKAFDDAYRDPEKARAKFTAYRNKHGLKRTSEMLAKKPSAFGPLRGRRVILQEEHKKARAAIESAKTALNHYRACVDKLNDNSRQVDADKAARNALEHDPRVSGLTKTAGASVAENTARRIQLERGVLEAARGLERDQLEDLPIRNRLRRTVVAETVGRLRDEAGRRRAGEMGLNASPPLTASPEMQRGFEAAQAYATAKQAHERALFAGLERGRGGDPKAQEQLTKAANALVNEHPKGLEYLSRFGRRRAEVFADASQVKVKTRARELTQRLQRFQAQVRETGRGVGMVLSLFRRG